MRHRHRSPGRWLAPLALVTCAVAVYAVVEAGPRSSGGGAATSTGTTPKSASRSRTTSTTKRTVAAKPKKTYTVQAGDVLSAIAAKTGVPVERLLALNPSIDAQTLRVGQKLRLSAQ
jgi:LysM repeat protein